MSNLRQHFAKVRELMLPLDTVFDNSVSGTRSRAWFSETLDANEFEISLHAVCDYLAESRAAAIDFQVLNRIRDLHEIMSIEDDCIEKLTSRITSS